MKHLLLLAVLVLAGCKFEAPLTEKPTRDVDPALLGSWFSLKDGKPFDVFKLSPQEYLVVDDREPFVCTHSDLDGLNVVSCRQIKNDAEYYGKYAYMAYALENGELVLTPLNPDLPIGKHASTADIRAAIEAAAKVGNALDPDPENRVRYRKAE